MLVPWVHHLVPREHEQRPVLCPRGASARDGGLHGCERCAQEADRRCSPAGGAGREEDGVGYDASAGDNRPIVGMSSPKSRWSPWGERAGCLPWLSRVRTATWRALFRIAARRLWGHLEVARMRAAHRRARCVACVFLVRLAVRARPVRVRVLLGGTPLRSSKDCFVPCPSSVGFGADR